MVTTIQKHSKELKGQLLIFLWLTIIGVGLLWANDGKIGFWSFLFLAIGAGGFFSTKFRMWWYHG